jgi:aerobic-type carbon monoxide dehydrogenase small subunit (CoxS/CutS family)
MQSISRRAVTTLYTSVHEEHNLLEPPTRRRNDMADELKLLVNTRMWTIAAPRDTPLLYVLTTDIGLNGPRFGCGLGQCGACSVLVDGVETRSCITPVSRVVGKSVTTLEGLPAYYAARMKVSPAPELHPLQEAMIAEQAAQCGYCFNGQIIKGAELLFKTPQPTDAQIRSAMNGHICRCGTYPRIMSAIQRAAKAMAGVAHV